MNTPARTSTPSSGSSASSGGNIKVVVRVRPSSRREQDASSECLVSPVSNNTLILHPRERNNESINSSGNANSRGSAKAEKKFSFDRCIWSIDPSSPDYSDQYDTYETVGKEMLDNALKGYNSCIMAYGQTGSGKTYTMMGRDSDPGLIPNLCGDLFNRIESLTDRENVKFTVQLSFFEIYQEMVRDLLGSNNTNGNGPKLKVREGQDKIPFVESLTEMNVTSYEDISALLTRGSKNRTTAATNMNDESSRSHSILTIRITQERFLDSSLSNCEKIVSHLRLVDLAGSERSSASGDNKLRQKEGSQINKSLTTLGRILTILSDISSKKVKKDTVVPYRESILTWLLKESIGGNSKTSMVACISPCDYDETLSTLRYATITSKIENQAAISSETTAFDVSSLVQKYEVEREALLDYIELLKAENVDEDNLKIKKLENYINWQHEYINTMDFRNQSMIKNLQRSNDELTNVNKSLSILNLNQIKNQNQKSDTILIGLQGIKAKLIEVKTEDLQADVYGLFADESSLVNKYLIKVE